MDIKIQKLGKIDNANLFFDPLRKSDSFLVLKQGICKMGFIVNEEIILESNFNIPWNDVNIIMGGFTLLETYEKIKIKISEQVK